MEIRVELKLKNGDSRSLISSKFTTNKKLIVLGDLDQTKPCMIKIEHAVLNTHLECSDMNNSVLLYLNEDGSISGASFISPSGDGSFGIITQAKQLLLLPMPIDINAEEVASVIQALKN